MSDANNSVPENSDHLAAQLKESINDLEKQNEMSQIRSTGVYIHFVVIPKT